MSGPMKPRPQPYEPEQVATQKRFVDSEKPEQSLHHSVSEQLDRGWWTPNEERASAGIAAMSRAFNSYGLRTSQIPLFKPVRPLTARLCFGNSWRDYLYPVAMLGLIYACARIWHILAEVL